MRGVLSLALNVDAICGLRVPANGTSLPVGQLYTALRFFGTVNVLTTHSSRTPPSIPFVSMRVSVFPCSHGCERILLLPKARLPRKQVKGNRHLVDFHLLCSVANFHFSSTLNKMGLITYLCPSAFRISRKILISPAATMTSMSHSIDHAENV